jgi:hypothetical protein
MKRLRREIELGIDDVSVGRSVRITSAMDLGSVLDGCLESAMQGLKRVSAEPLGRI